MRNDLAVTVYSRSTPFCPNCMATKRWLSNRGIEFTEVDMATDADALEWAKGRGHMSAPVVVISGEGVDREFSGFRTDLLAETFEGGEAA